MKYAAVPAELVSARGQEEPSVAYPVGMPVWTRAAQLAVAATLSLAACTAPNPSPTAPPTNTPRLSPVAEPTRGSTAPSPSPAAIQSPVPVGTARLGVLNAANDAFAAGDLRRSAELYQRVINTPPSTGESATLSGALNTFARFRSVVALAALGEEDEARANLEALQQHEPGSAMTRLADQFWHEYGQTADAKAACASVAPQLASVNFAEIGILEGAGAPLDPKALCSLK